MSGVFERGGGTENSGKPSDFPAEHGGYEVYPKEEARKRVGIPFSNRAELALGVPGVCRTKRFVQYTG
jgi:hypothetical protein